MIKTMIIFHFSRTTTNEVNNLLLDINIEKDHNNHINYIYMTKQRFRSEKTFSLFNKTNFDCIDYLSLLFNDDFKCELNVIY